MPNAADFRIVFDGQRLIDPNLRESSSDATHELFNLPDTFTSGERGILMCRIEAENADALKYTIEINQKEVVTFTHNQDRFGTIHEVINASILKLGENRFYCRVVSGNGILKISDVIVHFRVTI